MAREFERMSAQLQEKTREVRRLYEDTQAMNFSQEGKTGRLLMAKCRTLQVGKTVWSSSSRSAEAAPLPDLWQHQGLLGCLVWSLSSPKTRL